MSLVGQILDGKYAIVRRIAEGGTSTVYLGVNQRIGKDVAVKVLRSVVASDPEAVQRFEREARIGSRIRSAHVADVFDFGELPTGERFMVMEYLDGESLAKVIQRDGTIEPDKLASIAVQILDALAAAHSVGVIHRDLKPENVLVGVRHRSLVVKVVDFGISKLVEPDARDGARSRSPMTLASAEGESLGFARLTAAGSVLGTPLYMSPEQARGETGAIDHRTDLYSLGVMLYEALCGEPPLTGDDMNELLFRIALDEPEPLASRGTSIDPQLAAIVERAMAKDPNDRYQSADEMRVALEAWRERNIVSVTPTRDVPATPLPSPEMMGALASERTGSHFGRVRRWALAALFVAVGLVVGPVLQSRHVGSTGASETTAVATAAALTAAETAPRSRPFSTIEARLLEGPVLPARVRATPVVRAPQKAAAPTTESSDTRARDAGAGSTAKVELPKPLERSERTDRSEDLLELLPPPIED